jgi:exodeoxyribonuclease VII large subunit
MDESMRRRLDTPVQRADRAWLRLQALRPHARLERGATRLLELRRRLDAQLLQPLGRRHETIDALVTRLRRGYAERFEQRRLHLLGLARALDAVSPLATLQRGFAILRDADGNIVRSVTQAHPDQSLSARLADGSIKLRVEPSS